MATPWYIETRAIGRQDADARTVGLLELELNQYFQQKNVAYPLSAADLVWYISLGQVFLTGIISLAYKCKQRFKLVAERTSMHSRNDWINGTVLNMKMKEKQ